jgi:hypothetical protein
MVQDGPTTGTWLYPIHDPLSLSDSIETDEDILIQKVKAARYRIFY